MNPKITLRKDKKNKHGLYPVVIQVSEGKQVARIPLGFTLKSEDFDPETQTVLKQHSEHKKYNEHISIAKSKIAAVNLEVTTLSHQTVGLPILPLFMELYHASDESMGSILSKYDKEYGVQTEEVHFIPSKKVREMRYTIKFPMPISKYGEAMTLLKKLAKNEPDPKLDELLAGQSQEHFSDEDIERSEHFSSAWDNYYKHCLREKASSTSIRIPNNLQILKDFADFTKIPLTFESFTEDYGSELKHYLLNEHLNYITKKKGVSNGTVHNILKSISAFLNWAFKKGFNKSIEFKKWEKKKPKSDLQYLTESQLKAVYEHEFSNEESLEKSRDLWVFSAFSGMRWSDIEAWVPSNVTPDGLIKYRSKKAKKDCTVGLNQVSKSILDKYNGYLPKQNDALVNKNIKKALGKVGLDKIIVNRIISKGNKEIVTQLPLSESITIHSARRSFINLMISKKVSVAHLSTMTGNDVKSLMIYYKDDTSQMKKVMNEIDFFEND